MFVDSIPRKRPVLLLLDGHTTHCSREFEDLAKRECIEVLCLSPHTSHLYQPLDVGIYKSLKDNFCTAVQKQQRTKRGLKRRHFGKLLSWAWDRTFTRMNFVNAFKGAGLWPINRTVISLPKQQSVHGKVKSNTSDSTLTSTTSAMHTSSSALSDTSLVDNSVSSPSASSLGSWAAPGSSSCTCIMSTTPVKTITPSTETLSPASRVIKAVDKILGNPEEVEKKGRTRRAILTSRWITSDEYRKEMDEKDEAKKKAAERKEKEKELKRNEHKRVIEENKKKREEIKKKKIEDKKVKKKEMMQCKKKRKDRPQSESSSDESSKSESLF